MEKISFSTVIERASGWTNQVQINAGDLAEAEGTTLELVIGEGLKAGDIIRDAAFYLKVPFKGPEAEPPPPGQQAALVKGQPLPPAQPQVAPPPAGEPQPNVRPEDEAPPGDPVPPPEEGQSEPKAEQGEYERPPNEPSDKGGSGPPSGEQIEAPAQEQPEPDRPRALGEPEPGPFGGQVVRQPQEPQPDTGLPRPEARTLGDEPEAAPAAATSLILDVGHRDIDNDGSDTEEKDSLLRGYELCEGAPGRTLAGAANGTQFVDSLPASYSIKGQKAEVFVTLTSSGGDLKSLIEGEVWIYLNVTRLPGVY